MIVGPPTDAMITEQNMYLARMFDFLDRKNEILNADNVAELVVLEQLIRDSDALDLPASKAQLIRYRDHYYPKEEK